MDKALIIKCGVWDMYAISLYHVSDEGDECIKCGVVSDSDDTDLKRIIDCCQWTTPQVLYAKGGKKFKKPKDFIEKADKPTQQYLSQQVGAHILEAFNIASRLGIPIWMDVRPGEPLDKAKALHLSTSTLPLHPSFRKTEEGIDYRLTIADDVVPSKSNVVIISNRPSIVAVGFTIYTMDDGLNGTLLKPFIKHENIFIPQTMQDKYFRTFILRMAFNTDIKAEGFDIEDVRPQGHVRIILEQTIGAQYALMMQFDYDGTTFMAYDNQEKRVTLHDDGTKVCFRRVYRNMQWEKDASDDLLHSLRLPQKGSLQLIISWLRDNANQLKENGITVIQHVSQKLYTGPAEIKEHIEAEGQWLLVKSKVIFSGGQSLPLSSFRKNIIEGKPEYTLSNGETFILPDEWFKRYSGLMLFGHIQDDGSLTLHKSQEDALQTDIAIDNATPDISLPQSLQATLRPYQKAGYQWLMEHYNEKTGCILGDDMGLGKTVQAIAFIDKYIEDNKDVQQTDKKNSEVQLSLFDPIPVTAKSHHEPVLVVAPASVVHNWRNEFKRFTPSLAVLSFVGTQQERQRKASYIQNSDVIITTYQTLRNDIDLFSKYHFAIGVFDEAQAFKNRESQLYEALACIKVEFPLALSGTPMENNLSELWAVMSIVCPKLLGDYTDFNNNFIHPITDNLKSRNTTILQRLIAPYFLRRLKDDVLTDLPERQDEIVVCPMTPKQQSLYEETESSMRQHVQAEKDHINNMYVLAAITRLRQIACSPLLAGDYGIGDNMESSSGKLQELFNRLEELRGSEHKALLFSDYTGFLDIIADSMKKRGWKYAMLTGKTHNREEVIRDFQQHNDCQFFLVSLKAGGVGLNLTQADYVFLLDPWWNVAAEEQAISRAHRMGQQRSVFVYRMITEGTLEEKIMNIKDRKQSLIDAVLKSIHIR